VAACATGAVPTPVTPTASPGEGPTAAASTPTAAATTAVSAAPVSPATTLPTPVASGAAVDLCSLLTAGDLNDVLEGNFLEGELTSTGGYCHWDSALSPNESVITAIDDRSLETIKSAGPGGVDITAGGHAGYSVRNEDFRLQTTFLDLGGTSLILEFPITSNAADDLADAQELAEIAVGNL